MKYLWLILLLVGKPLLGVEHSLKGIADLRAYHVDSTAKSNSYLEGDYGKFQYNQHAGLALAQLGLQYQIMLDNGFSGRIVANGYADDINSNIGVSEAFISYKGLPNSNGWRQKAKLGVYYPNISFENIATAWSTPYTLTSSSLNNWVGEELRHTGVNYSLEKLGKFERSPHDFGIDFSLFQRNDTAGAMLAWHGWTLGSRQTLLNEKLPIPEFPAREDKLSEQASKSDPFLELDDRLGVHIVSHWQYQKKFTLNAGFYDNNAERGIVKHGQYTWTTQFYHFGIKYNWDSKQFMAQYINGTTLMTSPALDNVVDNKYANGFMMLRQRFRQHHAAIRLEYFTVDDLDSTQGDNNTEHGKSVTVNYRYQLQLNQFLMIEHNWINSRRLSRQHANQPSNLIERQWQLSYRYYY